MKFKNSLSHQQYQNHVRKGLTTLFILGKIKSILQFATFIGKMFLMDLTRVRQLMKPYYSEYPRGSAPRDPAAMLRALILMKETGGHSITKWVQALNNFDVYAILAGFEPDDVPGVGTFYDFIDRLARVDQEQKKQQQKKLKKFRRKPKKKLKKNQKQPPKHPDIVNKLVDRVLKYIDQPLHLGQDELLQQIFSQCFVMPSAQQGLLGDTRNMVISGDGTLVKTAASPYGIKTCDCKSKGIFKCDCPRRFSDPKARWGWDSYREIWVYGHGFFEFVACGGCYDLPIYFLQTEVQRNDGVSSVIALDNLRKLYPQFNLAKLLADAAMDNYGFYRLLKYLNIEPFIALNETKSGQFIYQKLEIDENGIPLCAGGFHMVHNGFCPDRMRHKWRCPRKASPSFPTEHEEVCKSFNYCTQSDYGRTFYTYQKDNLRLFPPTPRDSKSWKQTYKKRTSSERSNKRKKNDYGLEQDRVRSQQQWLIRYALSAMCQHVDAWYAESEKQFLDMCAAWEKEAYL